MNYRQKCNTICLVDLHYTVKVNQSIRDKWDMKHVFNRLLQSKDDLILFNTCNNFKQLLLKIHGKYKYRR